jgi:hypothetical protein
MSVTDLVFSCQGADLTRTFSFAPSSNLRATCPSLRPLVSWIVASCSVKRCNQLVMTAHQNWAKSLQVGVSGNESVCERGIN